MATRKALIALNAASLGALAISCALSAPLLERLLAAIWQRYKFGAEGHIMLSRTTGELYVSLAGVALAAALICFGLARQHSSKAALRFSGLSAVLLLLAGVGYLLLGFGGLNVWRA